jgi:hypothetical protein
MNPNSPLKSIGMNENGAAKLTQQLKAIESSTKPVTN